MRISITILIEGKSFDGLDSSSQLKQMQYVTVVINAKAVED